MPTRHSSAVGINLQILRHKSAAYLADVVTRIVNGHLNNSMDELLPWTDTAEPLLKHVA